MNGLLVTVGKPDKINKSKVEVVFGKHKFVDKFDVDVDGERTRWREKSAKKLLPVAKAAGMSGNTHGMPINGDDELLLEIEQAIYQALMDAAEVAETDCRFGLKIVSAADIVPTKAEWLMPGCIPKGAITTFEGDPAGAKSQASLSIAARVTRGIALPPANSTEGMYAPANVIISNFEDDTERTIVPRLIAAGADLNRVQLIREVEGIDGNDRLLCLPGDIPKIEEQIVLTASVLWIIDVFTACLDSTVSVNSDADIRRVMSQLSAMAERTGCAIVLIRHLNKKSGTHAMYRGGGSIAITGASRSVLLVAVDPEDPESRILASVKSNLCKTPPSLRFHVESYGDTSCVVWGDECDLLANDLLGQDHKPSGGTKVEQAKTIIADVLMGGPRGEGEVLDAIEDAGISTATYWRARKALGVKSEKTGFGKDGEWLLTLNGAHHDEF